MYTVGRIQASETARPVHPRRWLVGHNRPFECGRQAFSGVFQGQIFDRYTNFIGICRRGKRREHSIERNVVAVDVQRSGLGDWSRLFARSEKVLGEQQDQPSSYLLLRQLKTGLR